MARATITVTNVFQQIGSGPVTITILKQGKGNLLFNETASDSNANEVTALAQDQFSQTEVKNTFVRSAGSGWVILTDGSL